MGNKRYSTNGEWVAFDGRYWRIGLAASTAAELGDVTFVEAPALGLVAVVGQPLCTLEAVKAAADFLAPVSGVVAAVNPALGQHPELVSTSPEADGWILALDAVPEAEVARLLDEDQWRVLDARP